MNKLDKYIWLSIAILIIYTIIVLIMSCFERYPPSELTVGCFGFFGTEIASCALIKRWKIKEKVNSITEDSENE